MTNKLQDAINQLHKLAEIQVNLATNRVPNLRASGALDAALAAQANLVEQLATEELNEIRAV